MDVFHVMVQSMLQCVVPKPNCVALFTPTSGHLIMKSSVAGVFRVFVSNQKTNHTAKPCHLDTFLLVERCHRHCPHQRLDLSVCVCIL
jgi:hypothetical protein